MRDAQRARAGGTQQRRCLPRSWSSGQGKNMMYRPCPSMLAQAQQQQSSVVASIRADCMLCWPVLMTCSNVNHGGDHAHQSDQSQKRQSCHNAGAGVKVTGDNECNVVPGYPGCQIPVKSCPATSTRCLSTCPEGESNILRVSHLVTQLRCISGNGQIGGCPRMQSCTLPQHIRPGYLYDTHLR